MKDGKTTPEDMRTLAEQAATRLLGMPSDYRDEELARIRAENAVFFCMIRHSMRDIAAAAVWKANPPVTLEKREDWITKLLWDIDPDKYPSPEDNLGWGI